MNKTKNRFITGYSGLRALAVVGVILYHLDPNTFIGGYLGVPIFLVLSGYLVTDHMLKSYQETGSYDNKHFYITRLKRLYPQLITVLWACAAWIVLFQRNLLVKLYQIVIANLLNVYNIWQIRNGQSYFERFGANASPFTHLWTMSIEGQFYLLWPIVIFLLVKFVKSKKRIFGIITALTLISAIEMAILFATGADINRVYYGTDTRFFSLGLGAALAVIWPIENMNETLRNLRSRSLDLAGLISLLGMLLMFFSSAMNPQSKFPYFGGIFIFSIFTTVMVGIVGHPNSHWNKILTNPVFNWIGSRSYGIYLYQFPVMVFFEDKLTNLAAHPILYRIIEIVIILLISEITYRLIEKPFGKVTWLKVKNYWANLSNIASFSNARKFKLIFSSLIILIGTAGIIYSPRAVAKKSQLEQTISKNQKSQARENKELIKKYKKTKVKEDTSSKYVKKARKEAKSHPVNKRFTKYGISQVDLQLAQNLQLTAIGDSIMAGTYDNLKTLMPHAIIDGAVSRQMKEAFPIIDGYKQRQVLAKNVLIELGTNGPFTMDDVDHLMEDLGKGKDVFWINVYVPSRQWQNPVNDLLKKASKKYLNLHVIDWYQYAKGHPDWFGDDHVHPNILGSKYYSAFVVKSIVNEIYF